MDRFFYQSGLISLGIYVFFLLFLVFYFHNTKDTSSSYSFRQETFFEISLSNIPSMKHKLDIDTKKKNSISNVERKIIKEDGSLTHKRGVSFNSLFDNIKEDDSKSNLEEYNLETSKASDISRKYGQKSKSVSKTLSNINQSLEQMKLPASYSTNAVYNEYYSKINKLLTIEFNRQVSIKGSHSATVLVSIDSKGAFSYIINKKSFNDFFNSKLEEFLQKIKTRIFPPYENGSTVIKVVFKIEE